MLSDVGPIPEKAAEGHNFPFTDIATFTNIQEGAESVFRECVLARSKAGWHAAGKSNFCHGQAVMQNL